MPCYNSASLPKAEIWAVFAFIVFELPGLTGISGFALPRGHHLKLPVERSQSRASSWRKQFSCITSSRNSACGSGSQKRPNQQGGTGQARRVPPFPWEQFSGVSWEQESWLWLLGRGAKLRTTPSSWTPVLHSGLEAVRNNLLLQLHDTDLSSWHQLYSKTNSTCLCINFSCLYLSTFLHFQQTKL